MQECNIASRFFGDIFRVVAAVQFDRGTSIAVPAQNEDHVTCGVWSKSGLSRNECKIAISA